MRPKRVFLVSNSAFNIYHYRRALWQRLLAEGFELFAVANPDESSPKLQAAGIKFISLSALLPYQTTVLSELRLFRELCHLYQAYQPAVVLHFTIKLNVLGSLAASSVGLPTIATITGLGTAWLRGRVSRWLTVLLYRYALPKTQAVVVQNEADQKTLQKAGVKPQSWALIPGSGLDLQYYQSAPLLDPGTGGIRFLYVGRMLQDKGLQELFDAWQTIIATHPDASLTLVGRYDPKHPRTMAKETWRTGLSIPGVTFHGPQADVRPFLSKTHIVVLPSYREGLSRTLLEALAMERPVIAADVPGCGELVPNGQTGWLHQVRSSSALAEVMLTACNSSFAELKNKGQLGRQLVSSRYSDKIIARLYMDLIEQYTSTARP